MPQQTKVITKRRKFQEVEIPIIKTTIELLGDSVKELENKRIKFDLTRQLKGKSTEVVFKVHSEKNKLIANPIKLKLMPYFITRIIRKKISYVEDTFLAKSQESMLNVKPFLITRKKVSRVIRKTLRNKAKNWLEDYLSQKTDNEIFNDILSNKLQKPLSLVLKKTYPLSLCEIRILEIKRSLNPEEIPKKVKKKTEEKKEFIDQLEEIEEEKIKEAEAEIHKTQIGAVKKEVEETKENGEIESEIKEAEETKEKEGQRDKKIKKTERQEDEGLMDRKIK